MAKRCACCRHVDYCRVENMRSRSVSSCRARMCLSFNDGYTDSSGRLRDMVIRIGIRERTRMIPSKSGMAAPGVAEGYETLPINTVARRFRWKMGAIAGCSQQTGHALRAHTVAEILLKHPNRGFGRGGLTGPTRNWPWDVNTAPHLRQLVTVCR